MTLTWQKAVELIRPHVVRISTPSGSGTGFLLYRPAPTPAPLCGIATAAHVIDQAHYWEQPIRIEHFASGKSMVIRPSERAIFLDENKDTSVILFAAKDLPLPDNPPTLAPANGSLKVGIEVGWLGFPAVSSRNLCFFSGRISCFMKDEHRYLVDGVAINGVSGGPTFFISAKDKETVIGVVSAYIPNRATGNTLPGLSVVTDVSHFQDVLKHFKSLEEAKKNAPPPVAPPPNPEGKQDQSAP